MLKAIARLVSPKKSEDANTLQKLRQASARLKAARLLAENAEMLLKNAAEAVYTKFPDVKQMEENNLASSPEDTTKCVLDIGCYLKMVIYGLLAGNTTPIDEELLSDLHKTNLVLESSPSWYIEALTYIKNNHGLSGDAAIQANHYIDYIINALS